MQTYTSMHCTDASCIGRSLIAQDAFCLLNEETEEEEEENDDDDDDDDGGGDGGGDDDGGGEVEVNKYDDDVICYTVNTAMRMHACRLIIVYYLYGLLPV